MFHYRWRYAADIEKSGAILPRWRGDSAPEETRAAARSASSRSARSRGSTWWLERHTAPMIEASYVRFLDSDARGSLEQQPFLMGDAARRGRLRVYGQLSQLAGFDPTPARLSLERAPRVYAWVDLVDDLSGLEVTEASGSRAIGSPTRLGPLSCEVGRVYAPFLVANAWA